MPSAGVSLADRQHQGRLRPRRAVDPDAVLDLQPAAAAAKLPDAAALKTKQRPLPSAVVTASTSGWRWKRTATGMTSAFRRRFAAG